MTIRKSDCFVSVVAPLHDDQDIVAAFISEVSGTLETHFTHHEIVLVDDASSDATAETVKKALERHAFIRLLRLSRHSGGETAILAGLESVIGDFVVVINPDTDPPGLIPRMVELARGGAGIVSGVRNRTTDLGFISRCCAPLFYGYTNRVLKLGLPPHTTDFRVLSRQVVNGVIRTGDLLRFHRIYDAYAGIPNAVVPYDLESRRGRLRKRSFREVMARSVGIIVANSTHPLRVLAVLGVVMSLLNLVYAAYVLAVYFLKTDVAPGWATLSLQTAGMFFFLFLTLAALCAYVVRLLEERTQRPPYFVVEERKSSLLIDADARRNVVGDVPRSPAGENP